MKNIPLLLSTLAITLSLATPFAQAGDFTLSSKALPVGSAI